VGFAFKPGREADFAEFTAAHINKAMAIVLDGQINSAPVIQGEISGPGIISGPQPTGFTRIEQTNLLTVLRSGSLDVKPVMLSLNTIGPTLGENSIERGEIAALIGGALVLVFMVGYYFFAGVLATITLMVNLLLLLGIMAFLEATMTLPGIAGIVLTVGMAVDANILIYERIREEKKKGKTLLQAVKNGFERAFVTIVDANVTTFITGFILYKVGTGPVQGFAATLMIGICTSLFSALLVSKVMFAILLERGWLKQVRMLRILESPSFDFMRLKTAAVTLSVIAVLVSLALFGASDSGKYGLDFTGGFNCFTFHDKGVSKDAQILILVFAQLGVGEYLLQHLTFNAVAVRFTRVEAVSFGFPGFFLNGEKLVSLLGIADDLGLFKEGDGLFHIPQHRSGSDGRIKHNRQIMGGTGQILDRFQ